ncbi:hypothetical protein C4588_03640 [Candidatus Parcubacteria bacterium]|nr:MAG: hypothetical protein C4588_03640 [Candidatus Parcubacteria bacterium]
MKRFFALILILYLSACGPTKLVDSCGEQPILVRSPQPDRNDLEKLQKSFGIRAVINLRGARLEDWYVEEAMACNELGIKLINFKVSGRRPPTQDEINRFLEIIRDVQNHPILIHCQGGIHRTGVYVAVYQLYVKQWKADRVLEYLLDNYFNWGTVDRTPVEEWLRQHPQ